MDQRRVGLRVESHVESHGVVQGVRRMTVRRLTVRRGIACLAALAALGSVAEVARGGGPSSQRPERRLSERETNLVELGRRLFFEPSLSAGGASSCASCHDAEHGFGDARRFSPEDVGETLRHSQALIDVDRDADQHWDGEFLSVAAIVEHRVRTTGSSAGYGSADPSTPGRRTPREPESQLEVAGLGERAFERVVAEALRPRASVVRDLGLVEGFGEGFGAGAFVAFGRQDQQPDLPDLMEELGLESSSQGDVAGDGARRVAKAKRYLEALTSLGARSGPLDAELAGEAIEAYVATIRSGRSPYDRYRAGETDALSPSAERGLGLFRGAAGCVSCHKEEGPQGWPLFRDGGFHNNGISWTSEDGRVRRSPLPGALPSVSPTGRFLDEGRARFLVGKERERAFKTPSLRDVARHPPYMHDGSKATLEEVVEHYASGCGDDPARDARLKGFEATKQDLADLVAFLEALTSEVRPGLAKEGWKKRAERTRLTFKDLSGRPVVGLLVGLEAVGDRVPSSRTVTLPRSLETDSQGQIGYLVPDRTHVRLALPEFIQAVGGALVPDTCGSTDIQLRVAGRVRVVLLVEDPALGTPHTLRAYEPADSRDENARTFHPAPWVLTRTGTVPVGERTAVLYEGWAKRLGAQSIVFRLPGQQAPQEVRLRGVATEQDGEQTARAEVLLDGSLEWRHVAR